MSMAQDSGAKRIVQALRRAGVDCVFGLPGTQNVPLFEALRGSGLRLVVATNELSAAMMANGYFRASGRPGVLLTIPGPGFTWALTGLAEAALDSAAILHLTNAPAQAPGQRFQLQAIGQSAMAAPVTRKIVAIDHADTAANGIAEAWQACLAGEPGPVLVQVARGVWEQSASGDAGSPMQPAGQRVDSGDVDAVAAALAQASHCVLLLGQGCAGAATAATHLAERLSAAVVTTTSGRGVVAEDHPLSLGFALAGNNAETLNRLIEASDLVLAIGCKFSHNGARGFRLKLPPEKLIHVDASPEVLAANYPARWAIRADAPAFMTALLQRLGPDFAPSAGYTADAVTTWRERCRAEKLRDLVEPRIHGVPSGKPEAFFAALGRALPRESHLVTDSGRHQELARRHYPVLGARGLITPTNLQSMGFAIGAAIGAKLADPGRPVVALIGDGGLAMSGLELLAAVRERIDLVVIVFVDGILGAIRDQQIERYGHASGTVLPELDCAALAQAIGVRHVRLQADPETTLRAAIEAPGVTLVEVAVGDTLPMHWTRMKGAAKSMLGPRGKAWLRKLSGRA
ncbi:MAG: thiamine pyrophosphate-binding protein [Xanthomonadales bacterium]|nr:thiamine pyrophosphate-binding protein [Xanthomonadales bacterium]ODU94957.1 MAG: hypothetical protein ABT18_01300 [Rhodanobacter sp. SCN 66-43]OJY82297.1 MAG: hypothetical protein BGP23_01995 [Xanthomonadales bacterium 66-474]